MYIFFLSLSPSLVSTSSLAIMIWTNFMLLILARWDRMIMPLCRVGAVFQLQINKNYNVEL